MADNLAHLEREVEAARAKLAGDLAALRSPETFSAFADDLKHDALETKDALVEKGKTSIRSAVRDGVDDIKARAAGNPTAALLIGAGIGWHLLRRPPVATALVGAGLVSLLRSKPVEPDASGNIDYLAEAKDHLRKDAADMTAKLGGALSKTKDRMTEKATELTEPVKEKAAELTDAAGERVRQWLPDDDREGGAETAAFAGSGNGRKDLRQSATDLAADTISAASDRISRAPDLLRDGQVRDQLLLGVAAMAVAAAFGLSWQRRWDGDGSS